MPKLLTKIIPIAIYCIFAQASFGSDAFFLKRPPISTKCQAMLGKKSEFEEAIQLAGSLIQRSKRLQRSIKFDRKSSQARVRGLIAKIQMNKDMNIKKRDKHYENIIREGCPTF